MQATRPSRLNVDTYTPLNTAARMLGNPGSLSQAVQAGIGRLPSSRKRAPTIVSGITNIMPFFRAVTGLVFTR